MQLIQNRNKNNHTIQRYTSGEIYINHVCYTHSLILSPTHLIPTWPPQTIQALEKQHLATIIELKPEVVLLGTGELQHFLHHSLLTDLMAHQIGFEIMHTTAACHTFNLLASEGRQVVAGLIL